jgi:hypothetical protein
MDHELVALLANEQLDVDAALRGRRNGVQQ